MKLIAITGGIGAGKSVVSKMLQVMGYPVYDCDSEAKRLMTRSSRLVQGIKELIGEEAYNIDGTINREYMSRCIFADEALVQEINALVHPAVLDDIKQWAAGTGSELNFVETALLRESNMSVILDDVWVVTAPLELRIDRVVARNNFSREQVIARISKQAGDELESMGRVVVNDGIKPLLPQVLSLLGELE